MAVGFLAQDGQHVLVYECIGVNAPLAAARLATLVASPVAWLPATATGKSLAPPVTWFWTAASETAFFIVAAEFVWGVMSVCWTAKQPPKGPASALLRQRTVQTLPVEPPVQVKSWGRVTVMLNSVVETWDRPLAPGTLLVTVTPAPLMLPALPTVLLVESCVTCRVAYWNCRYRKRKVRHRHR